MTAPTLDALLADMRRKYLHARERESSSDGNWLKGDPITACILERWIPQVEAAALELARLESQLAGLAKPAPTGFGDAR